MVLEGPSGLDKIQFSMSPSPRSLEVTCSKCEEPDLREFKSGTHELVLLDEAKCILVFKFNKNARKPDPLGSVSGLPVRACTHTKCGRTKSSLLSAATRGRPSSQSAKQRIALGCARTQSGSVSRIHRTMFDMFRHDVHWPTLPQACALQALMSMCWPARAFCFAICTLQHACWAQELLALLTRLP